NPVCVSEAPAGAFDAAERRAGVDSIDARLEKSPPIVRDDFLQGSDYVVVGIGDDSGRAARTAMKILAKIIQRTPALGLLPNDHIRLQPDQIAFGIEIHAAPPGGALRAGQVEELRGDGGVRQR